MTLRQREPKTTIALRNGVIGFVPGGSASNSARKRFVPRESRIKNSTRPPILNRCRDIGTVERHTVCALGVRASLTAEKWDRRHQARRGQIALGEMKGCGEPPFGQGESEPGHALGRSRHLLFHPDGFDQVGVAHGPGERSDDRNGRGWRRGRAPTPSPPALPVRSQCIPRG